MFTMCRCSSSYAAEKKEIGVVRLYPIVVQKQIRNRKTHTVRIFDPKKHTQTNLYVCVRMNAQKFREILTVEIYGEETSWKAFIIFAKDSLSFRFLLEIRHLWFYCHAVEYIPRCRVQGGEHSKY